MKQLRGIELDNAIFELQQRGNLTEQQTNLLVKADVAYLQDREEDAAELLDIIVSIDNGETFDSIGK